MSTAEQMNPYESPSKKMLESLYRQKAFKRPGSVFCGGMVFQNQGLVVGDHIIFRPLAADDHLKEHHTRRHVCGRRQGRDDFAI